METQKAIVKVAMQLDVIIEKYNQISNRIKLNVNQIISDVITGQIDVQNKIKSENNKTSN